MDHNELADFLVCLLDDVHKGRTMQALLSLEEFIIEKFPEMGREIPHLPIRDRQLKKAKPSLVTAMAKPVIKDALAEKIIAESDNPLIKYLSCPYQRVWIGNQEEEDGPVKWITPIYVYGGWKKIYKDQDQNLLLTLQREKGIVGNVLWYDDQDWRTLPIGSFFQEVDNETQTTPT